MDYLKILPSLTSRPLPGHIWLGICCSLTSSSIIPRSALSQPSRLPSSSLPSESSLPALESTHSAPLRSLFRARRFFRQLCALRSLNNIIGVIESHLRSLLVTFQSHSLRRRSFASSSPGQSTTAARSSHSFIPRNSSSHEIEKKSPIE